VAWCLRVGRPSGAPVKLARGTAKLWTAARRSAHDESATPARRQTTGRGRGGSGQGKGGARETKEEDNDKENDVGKGSTTHGLARVRGGRSQKRKVGGETGNAF